MFAFDTLMHLMISSTEYGLAFISKIREGKLPDFQFRIFYTDMNHLVASMIIYGKIWSMETIWQVLLTINMVDGVVSLHIVYVGYLNLLKSYGLINMLNIF